MAEKEYIERGEIVRHIRRIYDELSNTAVSPNGGSYAEREKASLNGGLTVALVVETAAKAIPAADVVEVRHARWKDNHCTACGMMPMGEEIWDSCEFDPPKFEFFMDFCPCCGAKMDGGKTA